jgi:predicted O-methyltransferase YrrM
MLYAGEAMAAKEGAEFLREHLPGARHFEHPHATLEYALSLAPTGGMALEFGVFSGTTLKIIARARGGDMVYGFDSFEGLPEDWRAGFPAGTFAADGLPDVTGAELVPGLFDEVLPGFLETHPGPVDLLHIDSDLYSSAATVLSMVGPRLQSGSVVVFDEFFNYPGWRNHEYRAWTEFVNGAAIEFQYEAFTHDNEQVVITITKVPEQL